MLVGIFAAQQARLERGLQFSQVARAVAVLHLDLAREVKRGLVAALVGDLSHREPRLAKQESPLLGPEVPEMLDRADAVAALKEPVEVLRTHPRAARDLRIVNVLAEVPHYEILAPDWKSTRLNSSHR